MEVPVLVFLGVLKLVLASASLEVLELVAASEEMLVEVVKLMPVPVVELVGAVAAMLVLVLGPMQVLVSLEVLRLVEVSEEI